ncbi:MAG TPA: hypothetical protein VFB14_29020 [Bryobacteraceae bacterium]|nr:hypothetical protein [Bryobacteraceae bacterium]
MGRTGTSSALTISPGDKRVSQKRASHTAVVETAAQAVAIHNMGQARKRRAGTVMKYGDYALSRWECAGVALQMVFEPAQGAFVGIREGKKTTAIAANAICSQGGGVILDSTAQRRMPVIKFSYLGHPTGTFR